MEHEELEEGKGGRRWKVESGGSEVEIMRGGKNTRVKNVTILTRQGPFRLKHTKLSIRIPRDGFPSSCQGERRPSNQRRHKRQIPIPPPHIFRRIP